MSLHEREVEAPLIRPADNLSVQVGRALRTAVITGEMVPGVVYSVPALAELYGVSATPVREAVLDLVGDGLLSPVRNKGFRVIEVTQDELDQLVEVRLMLEVPAMRRVAENAADEDLRRLAPAADAIVAAAGVGAFPDYLEQDNAFHLGAIRLLGNRVLVDVVTNLRARTRLRGLKREQEAGRLQHSAEEHQEILDALLAHDPDHTETLIRKHIQHTRDDWDV
jgi:DNA-binding GntR family transcriptional regulator